MPEENSDVGEADEVDAGEGDLVGDGADDVASVELQRRGIVEKCPVCGSHVDSEAYHCPTCRNYFCFHCRARLLPADIQLQCVNQRCDYYGKLICGVCDPVGVKEGTPAIYAEPEDGYWPAWLILNLVLAAFLWYFYSPGVAAIGSVTVFVVGGYLLQKLGLNIFGRERTVENQRTSTYHSCISCKEPAKKLKTTP